MFLSERLGGAVHLPFERHVAVDDTNPALRGVRETIMAKHSADGPGDSLDWPRSALGRAGPRTVLILDTVPHHRRALLCMDPAILQHFRSW